MAIPPPSRPEDPPSGTVPPGGPAGPSVSGALVSGAFVSGDLVSGALVSGALVSGGPAPSGPVSGGPALSDLVSSGPAPSGPAPSGPAPSGPAPSGPAPSGPAPSGLPVSGGSVPGGLPVPGAPSRSGYYPQDAYYAAGWAPPPLGREPRRGHRGLILGITFGLVGLLLIGGVVYAAIRTMRTRPIGDVNEARTATARQVTTGHCIAELGSDGHVSIVHLVPCNEPHEAEVVGMLTIRDDSWPGQRTVDADVADSCEMDKAQVDAGFREVTWSPSESSWGQGDHSGLCIAWHENGDVTGSFAEGDVETS